MENKSHALIAGIFTVLLTIAVIFAVMWLNRDTQERTPYVLTTSGSIAGLNVQAAVKYRGMEVGKVEAIEFDTVKPGQILVRVGILPSTPITNATYAELGLQGLTGLAFIQLDADEKIKDVKKVESSLPEPARIAIRPSLFDRFSVSGEEMVFKASTAMTQINKLLDDDNQKVLKQTLVNLQDAAKKIGQLTDEVQPAAKGITTLAVDGRRTLARADDLMGTVGKLAVDINNKLDAVDRLAKSAEQIGRTAEQVSHGVSAVELQTLPRLNTLLDDAARGIRTVDKVTEKIGDEPASVLFGAPPAAPGPGEPGFAMPAGR
jgi:phospholipid/cholesterol/gamma-HCH transport system substrate-binding protein